MPVSSWSTTAASNNAAPPNGAPEGMQPGAVNDTIRQIMADVKAFYDNAALLNTANVFTQKQTAGPSYVLIETGATANNKVWDLAVGGEQFALRVVNDAYTTATDVIEVDRTLNVVDSINLKATSVQVNGTPINTFAAFKASATSRNSTTTFASDPDLAFTSVPAGTYEIEAILFFDGTTAPGANGGFKSQLTFSGTVANGIITQFGTANSSTLISGAPQSYSAGVISLGAWTSASTASTGNWLLVRGTVTLSNSNNVALQWAQNSSDSDNTTLQLMSRLTLRRIA